MYYQTLFLYSKKQTNCKTTTGQKFRRGQKFRLTPGQMNVIHVKLRKWMSARFELFSSFMFLCD